MNPLRESLSVLRLIILLVRASPSLLLSYTPKPNIYGSFGAGLLGIPVVPNISGLGRAIIQGGWLSRTVRILYRASLRRAARVFFQNPDDLALFTEMGLVKRDIAVLLPGSGVDVDRFAPKENATRSDRFVFLLVSRLLRDKGISEYVEAARIISRENAAIEFRIVGFIDNQNPTAFTKEEVENWRTEGVINYLGPTEDVLSQYGAADCVVLPSYREGCPRSLLEAASMAIPLIATDVPGCRQVVEHGVNGLLCRPYDATDLAEKMRKMLGLSIAERNRLGAAGRMKMLKEFDEKIVIDRYMRTVREFARR